MNYPEFFELSDEQRDATGTQVTAGVVSLETIAIPVQQYDTDMSDEQWSNS